jgi:hypothetical protein
LLAAHEVMADDAELMNPDTTGHQAPGQARRLAGIKAP